MNMVQSQTINGSAWLSRQKLALFASTLIVIGLSWAVFDSGPETPGKPYKQIIELSLPEHPPALPAVARVRTAAKIIPRALIHGNR